MNAADIARLNLADTLRAIVEVIGGGTPLPPMDRANADTRARIPVVLTQATAADGTPRGVWVRALSAKQRLEAELRAHVWAAEKLGPAPTPAVLRDVYLVAYERLHASRLVIEEAARMIVEPLDMKVQTVEEWGDAVIQTIHAAGTAAEPLPAALVHLELSRLYGGPLPDAPGADSGGGYPFTHLVDRAAGAGDGGPSDG